MGDFNQFSEAAILYARNAVLVTEMHGAMTEDIDKFLKTLGKRIQGITDSWEYHQHRSKNGYMYWWLTESGDTQHHEHHPLLYFWSENAGIVHPGRFKAAACAPKADKEMLSRLAAVAQRPELAPSCKPGKGGPWSLFDVVIELGDHNPLEVAAEPLAAILKALREVATEQASP